MAEVLRPTKVAAVVLVVLEAVVRVFIPILEEVPLEQTIMVAVVVVETYTVAVRLAETVEQGMRL